MLHSFLVNTLAWKVSERDVCVLKVILNLGGSHVQGTMATFWFSRGPCQDKNIVGGPSGPAALDENSPVMTGKLGRGAPMKERETWWIAIPGEKRESAQVGIKSLYVCMFLNTWKWIIWQPYMVDIRTRDGGTHTVSLLRMLSKGRKES